VYNGPILQTNYVNTVPYGASYITPSGTIVNGNVYPQYIVGGRTYYGSGVVYPYAAPYQYVNGMPYYPYTYPYVAPVVNPVVTYPYPYVYPYGNYGGCRTLINGVYYFTGSVYC
jgi:hypothetical protein